VKDRIVITGSNGFIGSNLSAHFHSLGNQVIGIDRPSNIGSNLQKLPGMIYYPMDLPDPLLEDQLREWSPDFLIHTAGSSSVPFSVANPHGDFMGSVNNFFQVLDAVRRVAPKCKVLFISSAAVYGNPRQLPVGEHGLIRPLSPYGYHKYYCEQIAEEFHRLYQVKVCCVRIFSAYGPGLMKQVMWAICQKATTKPIVKLFGTGKETRDFVHINDIAHAIQIIINKSEFSSDIYNLASGIETSIDELAALIVRAVGGTNEIIFSGKTRKGDPTRWKANIEKLSGLGFSPQVALSEGVGDYVKWALPIILKDKTSHFNR